MENYLAIGISLLTLIVISFQLYLIYKTYKADHERREKQSSIEFVNNIRYFSWPLEVELRKKHQMKTINTDDLDEETEVTIGRFLSVVEQLSVGVNSKVYNVDIVDRMIGTHLIGMYERLLPFMQHSRKERNSETLYTEYKTLYNKICNMRSNVNSSGEISHS